MGIRIGDHLPEPDIALLSPRRYAHERPTQADVLLIIEVSDSSLSFDLNEKAQLYAEHNILEYWGVDIASSLLHQHRSPTRGKYRESTRLASPETTSPLFDSAMSLDLQDFFLPDVA